jgi:CubicO group peptidase (beta-lactamase class C family)
VPGISYAVVSPDRVVYEEHAGVKDAAAEQPVTHDTFFMTYSMTKTLTAIAILQLAQAREVELDASLSTYVSDQPYGARPTLRMLLAHTAGVPNPAPLNWFYVEGESVDREEAYHDIVRAAPGLQSLPGTRYRYSNIGYWLLERVIEAVTGHNYADVIHTRIFEPLELAPDQATFELPLPHHMATGHSRKWSLTNSLYFMLTPWRFWAASTDGWSRFHRMKSFGLGYGGLYATISAFTAVLQDLLAADPVLLGPEWRDRMFEQQHTSDGEMIASTLGWFAGELNGRRYFGKHGGGLGFQGNVRIYPDQRLGTVYHANTTSISEAEIDARADQLDAIFLRRAPY